MFTVQFSVFQKCTRNLCCHSPVCPLLPINSILRLNVRAPGRIHLHSHRLSSWYIASNGRLVHRTGLKLTGHCAALVHGNLCWQSPKMVAAQCPCIPTFPCNQLRFVESPRLVELSIALVSFLLSFSGSHSTSSQGISSQQQLRAQMWSIDCWPRREYALCGRHGPLQALLDRAHTTMATTALPKWLPNVPFAGAF